MLVAVHGRQGVLPDFFLPLVVPPEAHVNAESPGRVQAAVAPSLHAQDTTHKIPDGSAEPRIGLPQSRHREISFLP